MGLSNFCHFQMLAQPENVEFFKKVARLGIRDPLGRSNRRAIVPNPKVDPGPAFKLHEVISWFIAVGRHHKNVVVIW